MSINLVLDVPGAIAKFTLPPSPFFNLAHDTSLAVSAHFKGANDAAYGLKGNAALNMGLVCLSAIAVLMTNRVINLACEEPDRIQKKAYLKAAKFFKMSSYMLLGCALLSSFGMLSKSINIVDKLHN